MGGLFGGGQDVNTSAERIAALQLQTSAYGGVLPIVYGTQRVSANLIDYDDFTATPHTTSSDVGKGGGSTISNTTYTYNAMIMLAVCESDGTLDVGKIWRDKDVGTSSSFGFTILQEGHPATPWSYLSSNHPTKAVGYAGTLIAASPNYPLTSNASLQNHSFEVIGFKTIGSGNDDAYADEVIVDFLTNTHYACGLSASRIADTGSYRTYCQASDFFISPVINEQRPALDWVRDMLSATNSTAIWAQDSDTMKIKIIPYGDLEITGNGVTYTPTVTASYNLTSDDFLVDSPDEDPIEVIRSPLADTYNKCPVQFRDRSIDYNDNTVDSPEQYDVDTYGLRNDDPVTLNCITRLSHAATISRALAQRSVHCRNEYSLRLSWKYSLLEPMDFVTLTEPKLGITNKLVRIKAIETDEDGILSITAIDWPIGVGTPDAYDPETASGSESDTNISPGDVDTPVMFVAPALFQTGPQQELVIGASGGANWGGCEVWISEDDMTYARAGIISRPARLGVLSDVLPDSLTTIDTTNYLQVQLTQSRLDLPDVTQSACDNLLSICYIGGVTPELLSYKDSTVISTATYNLTTLRRGAYGTENSSHAIGEQFARVDDAFIRVSSSGYTSNTLYVKFLSYNKYGSALQALSDVDAYTINTSSALVPSPISASLDIYTSAPGTGSGDYYYPTQLQWTLGPLLNTSSPGYGSPRWCVVSWEIRDWTSRPISYRVVLFTGVTPDDTTGWVTPIIDVPGDYIGCVIQIAPASEIVDIKAAVSAVYSTEWA